MTQTKSYCISKTLVQQAYERVKANHGSYGVDKQSIESFEKNLKKNLYRIWNRMSSGSYFPPAVREVSIPKANGGERKLGIPTVGDRVAQMVAKLYLEPELEPVFHTDSYGYRPGKSAIAAVTKTKQRCWQFNWVIDLDIKGFFDNIDHERLMMALEKHCKLGWIKLYVKRWLKAGVQTTQGIQQREKGTPQGGVISPILANLFLHYAFDKWMTIKHPHNPFERYADDIIIHCQTQLEAEQLLHAVKERLKACVLEVNGEKTKVVYCKDMIRKEEHPLHNFTFLGFEFRPRFSRSQKGHFYVGFLPAISKVAKKKITTAMRKWKLHTWTQYTIQEIARYINPVLQGWINYYRHFQGSVMYRLFSLLDYRLIKWCTKKYKGIGTKQAVRWWKKLRETDKRLFAHWSVSYAKVK
jgi:RNA-directed DNA polymerase